MCADVKCACLRRPIEARHRQSPHRAIIATSSRRHLRRHRDSPPSSPRRRALERRQRARAMDGDEDGAKSARGRTFGVDSRVSHCRAGVGSGDARAVVSVVSNVVSKRRFETSESGLIFSDMGKQWASRLTRFPKGRPTPGREGTFLRANSRVRECARVTYRG